MSAPSFFVERKRKCGGTSTVTHKYQISFAEESSLAFQFSSRFSTRANVITCTSESEIDFPHLGWDRWRICNLLAASGN